MPIASTRPNSDRLLSVKPNSAMKKKVPISDTGMATIGMTAARQVCRNRIDHQHDEQDRLEDRLDHRVDRLLDELGRVVDDVVLEARRESASTSSSMVATDACRRSRARSSPAAGTPRARPTGRGRDRSSTSSPAPVSSTRATSLSRTTAFGGLLDDDVGELVRVGQAAERLHRDLEGELVGHRRLVEDAGGDLDVLALQRRASRRCAVRLSDCSRSGSSQTRIE